MSLVLLLTGCSQDDAIDPLSGMFTAPTKMELTATDAGREKAGQMYEFAVDFAGGDANLHLTFTAKTWALDGKTYLWEASQTNVPQTILAAKSSCSKGAITNAKVKVTKDNDNYVFDGLVWLESGEVIHFTANGTLVYKKTVENNVYEVTYKKSSNGLYAFNISMCATSMKPTLNAEGKWQFPGAAQYITLMLFSSQKELPAGVYSAADVDTDAAYNPAVAEEGTFAKGKQIMLFGIIPYPIFSITVNVGDDGLSTTNYDFITDGTVTVEKDEDGNYFFTIDTSAFKGTFEGKVPAYTE